MPVWNVLVGDTRGDIEHDDTALSVDVVTITKTTKLLLSCSVPDVELDLTKVLSECQRRVPPYSISYITHGREAERVNFDTESRDVLLFEFTSQVTLDEGGLLRKRLATDVQTR